VFGARALVAGGKHYPPAGTIQGAVSCPARLFTDSAAGNWSTPKSLTTSFGGGFVRTALSSANLLVPEKLMEQVRGCNYDQILHEWSS